MASNLPLLPVDQPSFRNLRGRGFIYVDKTRHIYNLVNGGGRCFFLSRPRRFGKSLLVSTLQETLAGNRKLFDDFWIGRSDYQWQPHGVITLDLSALNIDSVEAVPDCLSERLAEIATD